MSKHLYKHLIFDLDGTTFNTDYSWLFSLQRIVKEEFHKDIAIEDLTVYRGMAYKKIYTALGAAESDSFRIASKHIEYARELESHNRVFEGIVDLLDALDARGIHKGVVTSRLASEMDDPLWKTIAHRFEIVIHAGMVKHLKPHPEPLLTYLQQAGVQNTEVLFLGDSPFDAGCAQNADVDFALATWGTHNIELDAAYRPKHPMDLIELL